MDSSSGTYGMTPGMGGPGAGDPPPVPSTVATDYGSDPLYGQDPTGNADPPLNDDLSLRIRRVVSNAYGAVKSRETLEAFAAITFEDLAQQQLDRLTGPGTPIRPNYLARVMKIEADLVSMATLIKRTPPGAFLPPDAEHDVNTPA